MQHEALLGFYYLLPHSLTLSQQATTHLYLEVFLGFNIVVNKISFFFVQECSILYL